MLKININKGILYKGYNKKKVKNKISRFTKKIAKNTAK